LNQAVEEACGLLYFPDLIVNYSLTITPADITAVTLTDDAEVIITATAHGFSTGDRVLISGCTRVVDLNDKSYTVTWTGANTFTLDGTDGDDYSDLGSSYDYGNAYSNYVSLPSDFYTDRQGNDRTVKVTSLGSSGRLIKKPNMYDFDNRYCVTLDVGQAERYCIIAGKMYLDKCPTSSDQFTITYYRKPTAMSSDSEEPEGIPSHLHRSYCVGWVIYKLFSTVFPNREMMAISAVHLYGYPEMPPVLEDCGGVYGQLLKASHPPNQQPVTVRDVSDDPDYEEY